MTAFWLLDLLCSLDFTIKQRLFGLVSCFNGSECFTPLLDVIVVEIRQEATFSTESGNMLFSVHIFAP